MALAVTVVVPDSPTVTTAAVPSTVVSGVTRAPVVV